MSWQVGPALRGCAALLVTAAVAWAGPAAGQQAAGRQPTGQQATVQQSTAQQVLAEDDPSRDPPTFRVSTSVVVAPTLVETRQGQPVFGLKASDFTIYDDGVEQAVHMDADLDTQPVALVVCVERGREGPLEFDIVRHLGPLLELFAGGSRGKVALVGFDSRPVWMDPFTTDTELVAHDLATMPAGDGGAAILDAVGYSVNLLEQQPASYRRVLLLIGEPRDRGSRHFQAPQLVERMGTSNTLVLSLAFSPSKAEIAAWAKGEAGGGMNLLAPLLMTVDAMRRNAPKTLAELSGGEYEPFTRERTFEARVAEVASHARNRYILSFHPTDPTPGLHTLQVKLRNAPAGARVVARNSYWAIERDGDDATGQQR